MSVISNIMLGGITGAIINAISCIRNILCYKNKLNNIAKAIIIILSVCLTFSFNNLGFIGLFPLVSTVVYVLFMNVKDVVKFKLLITFTMLMWFFYDIFIKSYTSACFDFFNILANFISIIQIRKNDKIGKAWEVKQFT